MYYADGEMPTALCRWLNIVYYYAYHQETEEINAFVFFYTYDDNINKYLSHRTTNELKSYLHFKLNKLIFYSVIHS
jgi:hypothetical protein